MKYLLDTNVCVGYFRGKKPRLVARVTAHSPADIAMCSVVLGELRYGAERSSAPAKNHAQIDAFVAQFASLHYDDTASRIFAEIRARLNALGTPIGPYDTMIAAIALAHGLILVTHNTAEFSRVPGLALDDWEIP